MIEVLDTVVFEQFVSHRVVKGFHDPVMPGLAGWDKCLDCSVLICPFLERVSNKLRTIIHPNHPGSATIVKTSHIKQLNDRGGIKSAVHSEGNVLAGVFINDVTDLDGFSVPG